MKLQLCFIYLAKNQDNIIIFEGWNYRKRYFVYFDIMFRFVVKMKLNNGNYYPECVSF